MSQQPEVLAELLHEGVIDAVHSRLMSGKEATVYVVERAGYLGAAKVYKARQERSFKKVSSYVEGRNQTRNSRDRRAMEKKSAYGRELMEEGWQDTEFRTLRAAFDAGVRVPEPFFVFPSVLLMELLVDEQGAPASRLADFSYSPEEATALHLEVFTQVKALLATGRVHGDLSAYNVLMAARGPTLIDFPQVVDVSSNANAAYILRRDLRNVTEHLARFDARLLRFADCGAALFHHYTRGTLDSVTGPEAGAPPSRGGRRGRDAERGRAGRDKGARADDRAHDQHARRGPAGHDPRAQRVGGGYDRSRPPTPSPHRGAPRPPGASGGSARPAQRPSGGPARGPRRNGR